MDMNENFYIGRLAEDVKYTPASGGKASRATGRLIVNRLPGKDGVRRYDAIPFAAWGVHADNFKRYTAKGKELAIRGPLHVNTVRDPYNGQTRIYFEVQVEKVSYGKDSTTAKLMKALAESGGTLTGLAATDDVVEAIRNNPSLREKLENIASGKQVGEKVAPDGTPEGVGELASLEKPEGRLEQIIEENPFT